MSTRIISVPTEGSSIDERQVLCAECAAICTRRAGVRATEWHVDRATNTICGVMKWTEYEAVAMGTEALCRAVACLGDADQVLNCRESTCPGSRRFQRQDTSGTPDSGFAHSPSDSDPRG